MPIGADSVPARAVVGGRIQAYLMGDVGTAGRWINTMPESVSPTLRFASRPFIIAVTCLVGALITAPLALWAYYGSAVFYEMILAGINACF